MTRFAFAKTTKPRYKLLTSSSLVSTPKNRKTRIRWPADDLENWGIIKIPQRARCTLTHLDSYKNSKYYPAVTELHDTWLKDGQLGFLKFPV
jgi:hypothetical protein